MATPRSPRGVLHREDGRTLRRTTVYLPPALARRLGHRAVSTQRTMSELITEAVKAMLARPA